MGECERKDRGWEDEYEGERERWKMAVSVWR